MAFGQMTGAVISGILLDRIGIIMIFRLSVGLTLLALALFVVMSRRSRGEASVGSTGA
jgi:predicted MFS family arabinose efflux permease